MRLFQSSITANTLLKLHSYRDDLQINVLRSYLVDGPGTIEILTKARHCCNMIILDSGTWSINQGKHKFNINLETYAGFLKVNAGFYDAYFGFDPVHGDDGTQDSITSQLYLEDQGFYPIPIIQNLEVETDYYCKKNKHYNIVAIGSTGQKKFESIKNSVTTLYQNGIKVHLFGVGSYKKLIDLPIWSSDCSSFAQWIKSGRLIYFNGEKEIAFSTSKFNKKGVENNDFIGTSPYRVEYENWIGENLGLSLDQIIYKHEMKMMVNSYYFWELEQKVQKIHLDKKYFFDVY